MPVDLHLNIENSNKGEVRDEVRDGGAFVMGREKWRTREGELDKLSLRTSEGEGDDERLHREGEKGGRSRVCIYEKDRKRVSTSRISVNDVANFLALLTCFRSFISLTHTLSLYSILPLIRFHHK